MFSDPANTGHLCIHHFPVFSIHIYEIITCHVSSLLPYHSNTPFTVPSPPHIPLLHHFLGSLFSLVLCNILFSLYIIHQVCNLKSLYTQNKLCNKFSHLWFFSMFLLIGSIFPRRLHLVTDKTYRLESNKVQLGGSYCILFIFYLFAYMIYSFIKMIIQAIRKARFCDCLCLVAFFN